MANNEKAIDLKAQLELLGVNAGFFYGKGGIIGLKLSLEQCEKLVALLGNVPVVQNVE